MVNDDSEKHREGNRSRGGMVRPARIRELRERARCAVNIVPVDRIAEDYEAVVRDNRRKIFEVVLRYLLDKRVIKSHLFSVYTATGAEPEKRIMTEINVVHDVNTKFIEMYESI